ncbi:uncharacterized protein FFNC_15579 [Fusarium fujikuroi]|nr:uncharacterized protein FFNC_15579 [Fusarium fujikuroi]
MTTKRFSVQQAPMVCMGSVVEVGDKFCQLNITSQQKFLEAVGISAPVDISNLLTKDSTELRVGDERRPLRHFDLSAIPNSTCLRVGDFATSNEDLSQKLRVLLELGEAKCRLGAVLDSSLPLECSQMTTMPVFINIYCSLESEGDVERVIEKLDIYLQHPLYVPTNIQYHNPQYLGEVDQSMVGLYENFRETQLRYLAFENLAPPQLKEGLRYLFQEGRQHDDMECLRLKIGMTTAEEWQDLEEELEEVELECLRKSYPEKKGLEWLVEPYPEASSIRQLSDKWQERILRSIMGENP